MCLKPKKKVRKCSVNRTPNASAKKASETESTFDLPSFFENCVVFIFAITIIVFSIWLSGKRSDTYPRGCLLSSLLRGTLGTMGAYTLLVIVLITGILLCTLMLATVKKGKRIYKMYELRREFNSVLSDGTLLAIGIFLLCTFAAIIGANFNISWIELNIRLEDLLLFSTVGPLVLLSVRMLLVPYALLPSNSNRKNALVAKSFGIMAAQIGIFAILTLLGVRPSALAEFAGLYSQTHVVLPGSPCILVQLPDNPFCPQNFGLKTMLEIMPAKFFILGSLILIIIGDINLGKLCIQNICSQDSCPWLCVCSFMLLVLATCLFGLVTAYF